MNKFGSVEVVEQPEMTAMPQMAATVWAAMDKLVGVNYKPVLYVGRQLVHGEVYVFLVECMLGTPNARRRLMLMGLQMGDDGVAFVSSLKVVV